MVLTPWSQAGGSNLIPNTCSSSPPESRGLGCEMRKPPTSSVMRVKVNPVQGKQSERCQEGWQSGICCQTRHQPHGLAHTTWPSDPQAPVHIPFGHKFASSVLYPDYTSLMCIMCIAPNLSCFPLLVQTVPLPPTCDMAGPTLSNCSFVAGLSAWSEYQLHCL